MKTFPIEWGSNRTISKITIAPLLTQKIRNRGAIWTIIPRDGSIVIVKFVPTRKMNLRGLITISLQIQKYLSRKRFLWPRYRQLELTMGYLSRFLLIKSWSVGYIKLIAPQQSETKPVGHCTTTKSGRMCQKWSVNFPHRPNFKPENPNNNFCSNPDGDEKLWCHTTDPRKRWEYCDDDCSASSNGGFGSSQGFLEYFFQ